MQGLPDSAVLRIAGQLAPPTSLFWLRGAQGAVRPGLYGAARGSVLERIQGGCSSAAAAEKAAAAAPATSTRERVNALRQLGLFGFLAASRKVPLGILGGGAPAEEQPPPPATTPSPRTKKNLLAPPGAEEGAITYAQVALGPYPKGGFARAT